MLVSDSEDRSITGGIDWSVWFRVAGLDLRRGLGERTLAFLLALPLHLPFALPSLSFFFFPVAFFPLPSALPLELFLLSFLLFRPGLEAGEFLLRTCRKIRALEEGDLTVVLIPLLVVLLVLVLVA